MNAHELRPGQRLLNLLHVHQAHDRITAVGKINPDIIFQSLDIEDVVEHDLHQFVFALDKDETVVRGVLRLPYASEPFQCPVGTRQKIIIADRLHEIVDRIGLVPVDGILAECRREDDLRLLRKNPGKFKPAEFRHLNI